MKQPQLIGGVEYLDEIRFVIGGERIEVCQREGE